MATKVHYTGGGRRGAGNLDSEILNHIGPHGATASCRLPPISRQTWDSDLWQKINFLDECRPISFSNRHVWIR